MLQQTYALLRTIDTRDHGRRDDRERPYRVMLASDAPRHDGSGRRAHKASCLLSQRRRHADCWSTTEARSLVRQGLKTKKAQGNEGQGRALKRWPGWKQRPIGGCVCVRVRRGMRESILEDGYETPESVVSQAPYTTVRILGPPRKCLNPKSASACTACWLRKPSKAKPSGGPGKQPSPCTGL